ncbi:MAG TPA: anthranilate synthase component I [Dehalococcoidia bacterium]|nr:anthranilate synthase component I [Dehalococcoidia bacterium]
MTYLPSLSEARRLAHSGAGNLLPVYREVRADLETPVSAYLKVARGRYSFLLESVEGGERVARYSFIGTEPYRVFSADGSEDPLVPVQEELERFRVLHPPALPRFTGGAVGYLAYEAVRHFEPRVPCAPNDPLGLPEALFMFVDTLLVFDHLERNIKIVSHMRLDGDVEAAYRSATQRIDELVERLSGPVPTSAAPRATPASGNVRSNVGKEAYLEFVESIREYIVAGDVIQVVPSQRLSRATSAAPFEIYRALRGINPSPYMYYLDLGDFQVAGASPEMLVRVEDGLVETHPIAGTRPRGRTVEEDDALAEELAHDEKELAEHVMLLDLGRNDVGRVSEPGSVNVTTMMGVERYSHVMHLVSHVTGRLRSDLTAFDALRACFPAGTVSGAPKVRAMQIIAELEPDRRGLYAGAVGYVDFSGNLDTAIAIRTMVMKDGVAHVQAGGGIVYDSVGEAEHQESMNKAMALLRAIERAESMAESPQPAGVRGY